MQLWHIGGDEGGIYHFMEILMGPLAALMKNLAAAELKQTIIGVVQEAANRSVEQLAQEENEMLLGLSLRAKGATASASANKSGRA
jgi:hypothetical protein